MSYNLKVKYYILDFGIDVDMIVKHVYGDLGLYPSNTGEIDPVALYSKPGFNLKSCQLNFQCIG